MFQNSEDLSLGTISREEFWRRQRTLWGQAREAGVEDIVTDLLKGVSLWNLIPSAIFSGLLSVTMIKVLHVEGFLGAVGVTAGVIAFMIALAVVTPRRKT